MYCKKCGAECEKNAKFCDNCGTPLGQQKKLPIEKRKNRVKKTKTAEKPVSTENRFTINGVAVQSSIRKRGKQGAGILLAVLGILVVALIAAGVLFYQWYSSPEQQIIRALKQDDYEKAVTVYEANFYGTENEDIEMALIERLDAIKDDFLNENETYEVTRKEIATIEGMKMEAVNIYAEEVLEYVDSLNASRAAYQSAEALYEKGDYIAAIEQYKQVIEEDPCYNEAKTKLNAAADAYRQDMLSQAEELADEGDYDQAINIIENALNNLEADVRLTEQLAVYTSDMETQLLDFYITEAREYAEADNLEKAIEALEDGLEEFPENADMLNAKADYQEQLKNQRVNNILETAKLYADEGDYQAAMTTLNWGMKAYADEEQLTAAYEEYEQAYEEQQIAAILVKAEQYVADSDYKNALDTLEVGLSGYPSSEEIEMLYEKYVGEYSASVLAKAKEQVADLDYSSALRTLQAGLNVLPDNEELRTAYDKYDAEKPVSITNIRVINGGFDWNSGTATDPFGNSYTGGVNYFCFNGTKIASYSDSYSKYAEYRVYGEYSRITGTIAPSSSAGNSSSQVVIIYADGEEIYRSKKVTRKTDAFTFDVDITGADYIQITLSNNSKGNINVILSNVQLWP